MIFGYCDEKPHYEEIDISELLFNNTNKII
jgi:hypothetical protein